MDSGANCYRSVSLLLRAEDVGILGGDSHEYRHHRRVRSVSPTAAPTAWVPVEDPFADTQIIKARAESKGSHWAPRLITEVLV